MPLNESRVGDQMVKGRGDLYHKAKQEDYFSVTHQTPGAGTITGQTAFVATTPTFLIDIAANANTIVLPSRLRLSQTGTVAGGPIEIAIGIDLIVRRASGGTEIAGQNTSTNGTNDSAGDFWTLPTAAAASGDVRFIDGVVIAASLGNVVEFDFEDSIILQPLAVGASLLIYTFAATTGPTWKFGFEWAEEDTTT